MRKFENRKCIYCGNEFTPRTGNQKTCGAEECQDKLKRKVCLDIYYRKQETAKKKARKIVTVKEKCVCDGCRYKMPSKYGYSELQNACDYAEMTGRSRLKIEMENGGYSNDSCPCYEKGKRGRRRENGAGHEGKELLDAD